MEKPDKEQIRKKIEEEIGKTESIIEEYKEMTKPVPPENAIGRISRMEAINNKSVAEAALRNSLDKLKMLKYMLTRIHEEDFGLCAKCKGEIPFKRLLLMPQSRFCVSCAS